MTAKINVNGILREMTAAELAAMQHCEQKDTTPSLTVDKKLELLLASIHEEPVPDTEPKLGYKWQPMYTPSNGFAWELVEDPTALGTKQNPCYWVAGMAVRTGHCYTQDGKTLYLALQDGMPESLEDATWFEKTPSTRESRE